jgi:hypothetical protein
MTHDPVRLKERVAINRYKTWMKHWLLEHKHDFEPLLTFAEWLQRSQIQLLPPEWPENPGRGVLPPDIPNRVHAGRRRGDATDFRTAAVRP